MFDDENFNLKHDSPGLLSMVSKQISTSLNCYHIHCNICRPTVDEIQMVLNFLLLVLNVIFLTGSMLCLGGYWMVCW